MAQRVVYTTCPDNESAERLASLLLEQRLAACISIIPQVTSLYEWQGKVEKEQEWLLMIKTTETRLEFLTRTIHDHHPYELPEVIAVPIVGGLPPYLDWIDTQTTDNDR